MDAAYLSLPQIPAQPDRPETRLSGGLMRIQGGPLSSQGGRLAFHHYRPLSTGQGLLFGLFYSNMMLSARRGSAIEQVTFTDFPPASDPFDLQIDDSGGQSQHFGLSLAWSHRLSTGSHWQLGLNLERVDIDEFSIDFHTTDILGRIDYAARYDAVTPYAAWHTPVGSLDNEWQQRVRIVTALPLPRQGFQGHIRTATVDASGDTEQAGHGAHIPDFFLGVGYTLEQNGSGLRLDLGASLSFLIIEPLAHKGLDTPLLLQLSLPLD